MIRPTLDNTLGTVLTACLFGVTTQQTVTYYRLSGQDPIILKLLVGLLWALDIAHVALLIQVVYEYAVSNFGNILGLEKYNSNVVVVFLFTGLSDFIIRGIYQHKIWALSNRNRPLCAFLATMAVVTFGSNIVITVKGSRCHPCEWAYIDRLAWIVYFLLGMITISDIVISATLCFFLGDQVRDSHSNRLNRAVRTLQVYIINAGILTSVCSLLTLILVRTHTHITVTIYTSRLIQYSLAHLTSTQSAPIPSSSLFSCVFCLNSF
ncbi:hypothetical protein C8Q74DRAFT_726089 [Fomes fomentarius]|nr:hypothetical protein C8Q74DRAFT_726089 [Fomes fomentarius]